DSSDLGLMISGWGGCPDDPSGPYNYSEVLQKAITFYDAQRAGRYDGRLEWRGDAFTDELEQENGSYPVGPGILDRYMDAGDTPTFVLPITFSMTTLAWSGIDFSDGWERGGQRDELETALRFHADWCMAAHPEPDVFCGQIGQGGPSHAFWGPPEIHEQATGYAPRIWWLDPANPGSEPAAEAAAFLAAMSMFVADSDPAYSAACLQHARELYAFANEHRGTYVDSIPDAVPFYNSFSGYLDELAWAATWLLRATGEDRYRSDAESHFLVASPDPNWAQAWDGKINGTALLLTYLTGDDLYRSRIEQNLDNWLPGGSIRYTPGGLAWLDTWGSLRYAANTSFLAFAHAELNGDPTGAYRQFGESQLNYMLGDNPRDSSYVCGFGNNPPLAPHHRGAHGSWNNNIEDAGPNRHTLWGALVGGPNLSDEYVDDRGDYIANEVACDYNAGFTAAMARMVGEYGGTPLPDAEFPPREDSYGKEMFVEASIIEQEDTFTRVRCLLNNRSAWPARWSDGLSYRIYLNLEETIAAGYGPEDVVAESGFLDGGVVGDLQVADAAQSLYYVEVSYAGVDFGPGQGNDYRRESQVKVGLRTGIPSIAWDPSNDPSLAELPFGQSAVTATPALPVYDQGALVYGDEGVSDCNGNGIDDAIEVGDGAADLDGNGRPDECDADCDADGFPDAYEIQQGAADCDGDGVPDDCQSFADCDGDGTPDACEIAAGDEIDCNGNGIPDACDLADGEADADGDGIPDACQLEGPTFRFVVQDQWDGGFVAELVVLNGDEDSIEGWTVAWDTPYTVSNTWNAVLQSTGESTEVVNEVYNPVIPSGGSITIGFQGVGVPIEPTEVRVNGTPASPEP
ncbi:MAG: glycoside hydrolase family 9 protein, partial [Planctomycetota bacterium]|nr:glycoside hydrolase family 9 protein [Planctomycetota bacterium]